MFHLQNFLIRLRRKLFRDSKKAKNPKQILNVIWDLFFFNSVMNSVNVRQFVLWPARFFFKFILKTHFKFFLLTT